MPNIKYQIPINNQSQNSIAIIWFKLAVASLVFAGFFAILLVFARTPGVQDIIPFTDFFHVALIVHVDLSVLIWFISFAGIMWSLTVNKQQNSLDKAATSFAILGTIIIIVSPFVGAGNPLMNNYVPILDHPAFIAGLLVFAMGMLLQVIRTISAGLPNFANPAPSDALTSGIYLSAWVALFAIVSLLASYMDITSTLDSTTFYEVLFWGGGHVLQFTHTVLLLVAWVWISSACGVQINLSPKVMTWLFVLVVIPVIVTPLIYLQYDVVSMEHRMAFMDLMKYGGLASTPLGLFIVWFIFKSPTCDDDKRPIKAALLSSILVFAAGGIIGFLIEGINVVIPAHYHGSIVGVTLAFMGLSYHLLPQFGYTKPTSKMAHWQPYIYGGGQLMHILGLAWSGGYGVQRKTAGAAQGLENLPEIVGMAMMGTGGGISIIGGVLFVIVMLKAFMKKQKA
ncbi:MAG: cbb3-type cytochrome c oxidase subunit I, partial [Gammaproteobacteria bacterium]|nr:cbb3-type cytochrome c oxidase subunit I [Gammaproteobacteria bacterium]